MKSGIVTFFLAFSITAWSYPKVQVDTLIDFSKEDSASLKRELKILKFVLESDEFWEGILEADFFCTNRRVLHHYRKRGGEFPRLKKDRHHYTNQEIHDLLWYGDDELGEPKDGIINLRLRSKIFPVKKEGYRTHGTTSKNTLIISSSPETRINNKQPGTYACHLLHEYMHVLGFKHKDNSPSKNFKKCGGVGVPLRIQTIARELIPSLIP